MKTYLKVGTSCLNQTPLDWAGNTKRIVHVIEQARESGVEVLCLPELAISGYGCEDQFLAKYVSETSWSQLESITPHCLGMVVAVGLPLRYGHAVWNAVALIVDGTVEGFYLKQHLAGDGIHYEPRWFKAWPEGENEILERGGRLYSVGDITLDVNGVRIGVEVCEDSWVADRSGKNAAMRGCDIILNPSASHFAFGKQEIRQRLVSEGSRAFSCTYLYANLLGNEAGRAIYDGGAMIAHAGHIIAESKRFSYQETLLETTTVDLSMTRLQKAKLTSYQPNFDTDTLVYASYEWKPQESATPPPPPCPLKVLSKEEEFTYAVTLGLFDYMRKSFSRGFVVSLSGGADSAAVSCLVWQMHRLALQELGADGLQERLSYWPGVHKMSEMLFTVYQATENSGSVTENAAETLANSLGASYNKWDVDPILKHYHSLAEQAIERPLNWDQDDLTLQNIQARVRAPGVWMMANIRGALLVSTSNRSEAAVGYATMDGDTSGGISPLAGIDKDFLRQWLRWLEQQGSEEITCIQALHLINAQQPTAELRPAEGKQTDEEDLMPYAVLDEIESYAIRDKKGPLEVYHLLCTTHSGASDKLRKQWIVRFFTLWSRNQWKRERYAPSFHLDDKNLDPKTWCRFPILSGAFREELETLKSL